MVAPEMQRALWLCNIAAATHIIRQNWVLPHPAGPATCTETSELGNQLWNGLLDAASKFALFSVSDLKDEKLIKSKRTKQTYMKTETCKLYSRVFGTFKPNFTNIDPYNFKQYRFKVGALFETQCTSSYCSEEWVVIIYPSQHIHLHWY